MSVLADNGWVYAAFIFTKDADRKKAQDQAWKGDHDVSSFEMKDLTSGLSLLVILGAPPNVEACLSLPALKSGTPFNRLPATTVDALALRRVGHQGQPHSRVGYGTSGCRLLPDGTLVKRVGSG